MASRSNELAGAGRAIVLAFTLIGASACGGKVAVDRMEAAGGAGAGGAACGNDGLPVPAEYKVCSTDSVCTIELFTIDCCGSKAGVSVAVSMLQALADYRHQCDTIDAVCGCDPGPLVAEDGNVTTEATKLHAACLDGLCSTFVE